MKRTALAVAAFASCALAFAAPKTTFAPVEPAPVFHCQVPCGIYGDMMRIGMMHEDAATISKGMTSLHAMDGDATASKNQMVRWIMNKDDHAQAIQDQVASYWLAQRIKTPADASDAAAMAKYHKQLELLHRITVAAMKCKQTVDLDHVVSIEKLSVEFSETYFTGEDLEHIREHHGSDEKHR